MLKEESLLVLPIIAPLCTTLSFPKSTLILSHAFSPPFCDPMSLKTPTGEPENATALELPRLPHARNWPLFRVCYRFKALQGEQRSLWTSNGNLIPDLRSHITTPEAFFMPAFPLPPMQFPTPLCIHLRHSTRGAIT